VDRPRATLRAVRRAILAASAASIVFAFTGSSRANGRFPAANQLVFGPNDPNFVVLRTTYAVLPSSDNGATWRYLCEGVLGLPSDQGEDPSIGVMADDSLLAGVAGYVGGGLGVSVSADRGCNWNCIGGGLAHQSVVDIAVRPDTPTSAVAITGTYEMSDSATAIQYSQIFETTDNGKTWAPIGTPIDPTVMATTIEVAKSDPQRIYVTGTRGLGSDRTASLFVTADRGNTWVEKPIPQFDPKQELAVYIGAVDPTNADRVYLRSSALVTGGQSRLYFTTKAGADAGTSFSLGGSLPDNGAFDVEEGGTNDITGELLGLALSPDGSKIFIGTVEAGLWMASTSDMVFRQKNPNVRVKCLGARNAELWACSDIASGFVVGESLDDGATFMPKMHYVSSLCGPIECAPNPGGPLGCGATDNASSCGSAYQAFCLNDDQAMVCGSCGGDGGTAPDAATAPSRDGGAVVAGSRDAGGGPRATPSSSSSCGCSVVGGRGATGLAAVLAFTGMALRRRRASRRRPRR
jgi:Sortilin, neurotensin receptor 3,